MFFDYTENSYKNLVDVYFILIQNNAAVVKYPDIEAEMNQIVTMAIESSSVYVDASPEVPPASPSKEDNNNKVQISTKALNNIGTAGDSSAQYQC